MTLEEWLKELKMYRNSMPSAKQLDEWLKELKAYRENDKEYLQTLRYADMPTVQSAT